MKSMVMMIATVAIFVLGTSFSANNGGVVKVNPKGDNTCTVIVKYSGGSAASSIKVVTEVGGGISCVGGRTFYTDSDGKVTVAWSEGCKLAYIYVDGTSHKGDYENDGTYTFTIN